VSVFIPTNNTRYLSTAFATQLPAVSDITVSCWAYLSAATPAAYRMFVTVEPNIALGTGNDGVSSDFGTSGTDHLGPVMAVNQWYHCVQVTQVITATSQVIRGYLNGKLVVAATAAVTFTNVTGITIGNYAPGGFVDSLNGQIRDVRVWQRLLTGTEVQEDMHSATPNRAGLVCWAPLDLDLAKDKSGNGHQFTTTGAGVVLRGGRQNLPVGY